MTMLSDRRRSLIIEELNHQRLVKVSALSDHMGVSEVSIRRDLQILEQTGRLKRVHGGAVSVAGHSAADTVTGRAAHSDVKERIGRAAAELVCHNDSLIFDSGSTALHVARSIRAELLNSGNLTVITAYLPAVQELGQHPGVHTILLGGIYLPNYQVLVGPQTIDQLKGLHADKMFLGTDGMTFSQGITTANVLEAEVDRAMARAASQVIVVSDSSKINVIGLASIIPVTDIDMLITDHDASPDFIAQLKDHGVEVIQV